MPESSWVIGSHASVPETTVTVVANSNSEDLTFPAGSYYVHDPSDSLSALTTLCDLIATHADISTCTGALRENRLVEAEANVAFTASFSDDTLRDLLGLTGNWTTSQATQVGDVPSGYMFVPGKCAVEEGPVGSQGMRTYDTAVTMSGPGNVSATQHQYHTANSFMWRNTANARVWSSSEGAGEWVAFHRNCLRRFYNWKHYGALVNDEGSTSTITLASPQGPYIMRPPRGDVAEEYSREIPTIDRYLDRVELAAVSTAEYSNS